MFMLYPLLIVDPFLYTPSSEYIIFGISSMYIAYTCDCFIHGFISHFEVTYSHSFSLLCGQVN